MSLKFRALALLLAASTLGGCFGLLMKEDTPEEKAAAAAKSLEDGVAQLPQRQAYPPAGMRDPKWESYMVTQLRLFGTERAKANMEGAKLASVQNAYFADQNWSPITTTSNRDINASDGTTIATTEETKITGRGAAIWIIGRTAGGHCVAIKGALNLEYNGVDWLPPAISWGPDATTVFDQSFQLPCR
jgi:hypothetical protein